MGRRDLRPAMTVARRMGGIIESWYHSTPLQARRSEIHEQTDGTLQIRLARITNHPCGAKRHPRSSVFSIPSPSDATSIQSFLDVAQGRRRPPATAGQSGDRIAGELAVAEGRKAFDHEPHERVLSARSVHAAGRAHQSVREVRGLILAFARLPRLRRGPLCRLGARC